MAFFIAGIFFWTLCEYLIHRFLGHVWTYRTAFRKEHQKHHHKRDYFASPWDKFKATLVFGPLVFSFIFFTLGLSPACFFTSGFLLMYLYYEYLHKTYHIKPPRNIFGRYMRKHHLYHHFVNDSMNHGVSIPLWDFVFATFASSRKVVPINNKFSMSWLFEDRESGVIKPQFSSDYAVVEKTRCT